MPIRRATSLDLPAIAALHIAIAAELRALAPAGYGRPLETMPGAGDVAGKFRDALPTEETHKERVRGWLSHAALADAQRTGDARQQASMH